MKNINHEDIQIKSFKTIFITGLLTLLPSAITISLIFWLFNRVDSIFREPIEKLIGFQIYGIGFIITVILILITGIFATNVLGKKIFKFFEGIMFKVPLVGMIYASIKQVFDGFAHKQKDGFKSTVLVEYPSKGIYTLGFLTSKSPSFVDETTGKACFSVFVPTTPNPTSGMLVMMDRDDITYLDIPIEEAIKLIVSAGIVFKKEKQQE